jgi:hypothetical protein
MSHRKRAKTAAITSQFHSYSDELVNPLRKVCQQKVEDRLCFFRLGIEAIPYMDVASGLDENLKCLVLPLASSAAPNGGAALRQV